MSCKVLRTIGVILSVLYVLGIVGAVILWFSHYYVMQEGYYGFGDSLMIACCVCGVIALIGQLGVPLIIISFVVKSQQAKRNVKNTQAVAQVTSQINPQPVAQPTPQPVAQNVTPQSEQNTSGVQTKGRYCGMCGAENSAQARFCPYCGNKLF